MSGETTYRIGEAARLLSLKTYVLRFWESEFPQLSPMRTDKGQRLYTEDHIALLRAIKHLLHEQGMTIDGARRRLAAIEARHAAEDAAAEQAAFRKPSEAEAEGQPAAHTEALPSSSPASAESPQSSPASRADVDQPSAHGSFFSESAARAVSPAGVRASVPSGSAFFSAGRQGSAVSRSSESVQSSPRRDSYPAPYFSAFTPAPDSDQSSEAVPEDYYGRPAGLTDDDLPPVDVYESEAYEAGDGKTEGPSSVEPYDFPSFPHSGILPDSGFSGAGGTLESFGRLEVAEVIEALSAGQKAIARNMAESPSHTTEEGAEISETAQRADYPAADQHTLPLMGPTVARAAALASTPAFAGSASAYAAEDVRGSSDDKSLLPDASHPGDVGVSVEADGEGSGGEDGARVSLDDSGLDAPADDADDTFDSEPGPPVPDQALIREVISELRSLRTMLISRSLDETDPSEW